tara:strand:+ start:8701 stop:9150 length:450 start_codon:yes stop_codon:yes gene_type:complete
MAKEINPTKMSIHEVLELVGKTPTKVKKSEVLKTYESLALKTILRGAFDEKLEFNLPKGKSPYEPANLQEVRAANTHQSMKKMRYFVKGGEGDQIMAPKREKMWIGILETVLPEDAKLFDLMKDKKLMGEYKGVTKKLVQDTWPNLIKE